ncbi:MAG: hypothetical protein EPN40_09990 [Rhodanobacteraceae bacterium]|nr:MAG: hypothetical protein EPN40_09990 [Rhodanobacteraceae bacterium]
MQHWIRSLVPVRIWAVAPDLAATHSPSVFTAYAGTIPANTLNTQCSLDAINGKASADAGAVTTSTAVYFGGWAGNGAGAPLGSGLLVLAGETQFFAAPLTTGASRSDVAHALGDPALAHSGYNLEATLTRVPAGRYALYVASASAQAQSFCNLHRTLTVRE